ncbi:MAG TPA: phospho-sugar mutase [Acidimicrobiia bacterium]|nr:phospho-sugar mutase [Acidimicrobiia bacterium]
MTDLIERARKWIETDPDPGTRRELAAVIDSGDLDDLESRMETALTFGTAGIRGEVGAGPGRMNRAVVIRTTFGLADYLAGATRPVVVGFDARPTSRSFAEDTAGVLAAAGIPVLYFPKVTPTPLVAFAAKHLGAIAAVVVTASHNPPADNGYKVYGEKASQIVSPVDLEIQAGIDDSPGAADVPRIEGVFDGTSEFVRPVPEDILDCYWEEVSDARVRTKGSDLDIVYTPIHGVGGDVLLELMRRAGHNSVTEVPEQAEPDGSFPTVSFPNPEEPGALDLARDLAEESDADLIIANDPDADRLAAVVPHAGKWRNLTGNEIGVLLGDYVLSADPDPGRAIVVSSIVSSPMLSRIAAHYGARHESTLTGFKWIVKAGLTLEEETDARFVFGYEEALGFTVGSTVRDKDGMSAGVIFTDLVADLKDHGKVVTDRLHELWRAHGLWVSSQVSIVREGVEGSRQLQEAVARLADNPPDRVGGREVVAVTDYRTGGEFRPLWLGAQDLVELDLGEAGRMLVRPSGTEPKLKVYVDLCGVVTGDPDADQLALADDAAKLGEALSGSLGV